MEEFFSATMDILFVPGATTTMLSIKNGKERVRFAQHAV
jgi:hypothetical protein